MKALVLNAGRGVRMKNHTTELPKCLVELINGKTTLYYQLKAIKSVGIKDVVIATGFMNDKIESYVKDNFPELSFEFAYNEKYASTNHIYSTYLASKFVDDDIFLVHGDMVFEPNVLKKLLDDEHENAGIISSTVAYSEKDFRCVIENDCVRSISIHSPSRLMFQPLYKLCKRDWLKWSENIGKFCEAGNTNLYVEEALNPLLYEISLFPLDILDDICYEIDDDNDLTFVMNVLQSNTHMDSD